MKKTQVAIFAVIVLFTLILVYVNYGTGSPPPVTTPDVVISTIAPTGTVSVEQTAEAVIPTATPETPATPVPQPTGVGVSDRMVIPKIGVNAPLVFMAVPPDGIIPAPSGSREIVYYGFPYHPEHGGTAGVSGNAIFSGHVDFGTSIAVLWDLNKLQVGDEIQVRLGSVTYVYRVIDNRIEPGLPPADDEFYWNRIVAATDRETITVITCTGNFDPVTRSYDKRRVVKALRVQ